jgi:hypothetical protein
MVWWRLVGLLLIYAVLRGLQTATAAMAVTTRDVQPIRKGQVVTAEVRPSTSQV